MTKLNSNPEKIIVTSCGMCYGTCTIKVYVKNGIVTKIEGEPDSPQGYGNVCAKGIASILELYDTNRVKKPLIRTNPEKGLYVDPRWKPVSWEEAIDLMVGKLRETIENDPRGVYFASSATFPTDRAFNVLAFRKAIGTPNYYCSGGGLHCGNGAHMIGGIYHASWSVIPDFKYCNYAIYWGCSKGHGAGHAALVAAKQAADAKDRGMRLVVFDPFSSTQASTAEEWIPIRVGTDAVVALAMANLLVNEYDLYDDWYLKWKTNAPYLIGQDELYVRDEKTRRPLIWDPFDGRAKPFNAGALKDFSLLGEYEVNGVKCKPAFQLFREHVKKYTPEYASEISGVPASTIRRVAREFGEEAKIGSKIVIEGKELPYRPVSSIYFRGSQGHYNQAWNCVALVLLNHLVGAADVPGGALAFGPPVCSGHPETEKPFYRVIADADGLLVAESWPYSHLPYPPHDPSDPPQRLDLQDLFYVPTYTTIMMWDNNEELWEKFKIPYRPEVMIAYGCNQVMSVGNPETVLEKFLKKFKFIVSFNIYSTEFENAVADLVIPDTTYLERYSVSTTFPSVGVSCHATGLGEWVWAIRQPVIEPLYGIKSMIDVVLEVVERLGLRERYIDALYEWSKRAYGIRDFSPENRLDPKEKLSFQRVMDSILKETFGPSQDLEWFKKYGFIKWKNRVEEVYWRAFTDTRVPIYFEWVIRAGHKSRAVAEKYGAKDLVDWSAHTTLPDWRPCESHKAGPEYDLYGFYWRSAIHTYSRTMQNPWLDEVSQNDPYTYTIQMHPATARKKGIDSGDLIWLENPKGRKVRGRVFLTEGIRPEHIGIAANSGHWANTLPLAKGKGVFFNALVEVDKEHTCPLCLGQDICVRLKAYK